MDNKEETKTEPSNSADIDMIDSFKTVHLLLQNMQDKFNAMSEEIIHRIDDMGNRINELEQNINDLMQQADNIDNEISSTSDPQQNNTIGQSNKDQQNKTETNENKDS